MDKQTIEEGKPVAITAYILIVGALIAMSMNSEKKNPYASFHIRQAMGLSILFIALGLLISNFASPMVTFPFWLFMFVLWTYGIYTAITSQVTPIPLLGKFFQRFLKML